VITCPACSKQNQDHYRFCLGCGAELPRGGASGDKGVVDEPTREGPTTDPPAAPLIVQKPATPEPVATDTGHAGPPPGKCPECDYVNPPSNRFCASCGYRLDESPKPAAKKKAAAVEDGDTAAILIALDPEGNEVGRHQIMSGETVIGRDTGGVFGSDTFLSPSHARFVAEAGGVTVVDLGSLNGVFRKLLAEQRSLLQSGQRFRVGQELLQFDALDPDDPDQAGVLRQGSAIDGFIGRVSLVVGRETVQPSYPMPERGMNLGRERGDVLFPEDGYVSGLHCHLSYEGGDVFVTDLGSSNGTFVQLLDETDLKNGDVLLMGQQLFRVTI
jgi:pSer/pThr/pTyr-binding forkhead associated (FHA) protein